MGGKKKSKSQLRLFLARGNKSRTARDAVQRKLFPEYFVDQKLKRLEEASDTEIAYIKTTNQFIIDARLDLEDEISESIWNASKPNLILKNQYRIVKSRHSNDPLCTFGSIRRPPGGRFNFGQTTRQGLEYFHALYVAEDYDTSFNEVYHSNVESPGDFTCILLDIEIDRYLDLTDEMSLKLYFDVI